MPNIKKSRIFEVYESMSGKGRDKLLYTINAAPGTSVYGEELIKQGAEYREWDPWKSKIASGILKGAQNIGIRKESIILYLGSSSGTTVSHVSDMAAEGLIYAVDISAAMMREFMPVAKQRDNIIPILASASNTEELQKRITAADVLFQDIAQRDQVGIFLKNCNLFLKKGGYGLLAVKARSIDVTKPPRHIFSQVRKELEKPRKVIDYRELHPFQKDHCLFIVK